MSAFNQFRQMQRLSPQPVSSRLLQDVARTGGPEKWFWLAVVVYITLEFKHIALYSYQTLMDT
jgi:hypothetical protein